MNATQLVVTILVLVLVAAGSVVLLQRIQDQPSGESADPTVGQSDAQKAHRRAPDRDPATWDLSALPVPKASVRTFDAGGARVVVVEEGDGEPAALGRPIDLRFAGYLLDGTQFDQGVLKGVVVGMKGRYVEGLVAGLEGIRPYERRRILVPNALGYGARSTDAVPAHADLVFDVRWIYFQVTVLDEGAGRAARLGDKVEVLYTGRLEDGTVFDTTDGKAAASFTLKRGGLIEGWVLGLKGMKEGGRRRLWVPSHLGYREQRAAGGKIPPHSNLLFEVQLLRVIPKDKG